MVQCHLDLSGLGARRDHQALEEKRVAQLVAGTLDSSSVSSNLGLNLDRIAFIFLLERLNTII